MRVFIIAPEASGKTTLLAMLSRYIAHKKPDNSVLEPNNKETMEYISEILEKLEDNTLESTVQGKPKLLSWTLKVPGASDCLIEMFDSAGQDLRVVLDRLDKPESLPANLQEVKRCIDNSDMLIYLLDLQQLYANERQIDDLWILRSFIKQVAWQNKTRMIVVSKADINMPGIDETNWSNALDVKAKIREAINDDYAFVEELLNSQGIEYLAVSAISTRTEIDSDNNPVRVPVLRSKELDKLTSTIICYVKEYEQRLSSKIKKYANEKLDKIGNSINKVVKKSDTPPPIPETKEKSPVKKSSLRGCIWSIAISLLIIFIIAIFIIVSSSISVPTHPAPVPVIVTCPTCKGESPKWLIDKCKRCGNSGKITK